MVSKKISLKIKFEREKRGISQEKLALEAGISRNALWKIESNKVSPTVQTLEKIAQALDMDFSALTDVSKVDL